MFLNDRPQFAFCYLTQLSYFGMISYLGVTSWHTLSEWRRERGLRIRKEKSVSKDAGSFLDLVEIPSTTVERQHWLLTDMNFFLYHTICTFHVIVPILFWGYLGLEGDAKETAVGMKPDGLWRNYSFHGGDLIVLMIEVIINTMSFVPSHVAIVFVICLLYLAEAHVVYAVDGFWIYPFLDTTGGPIWVALYLGVGFVILCAFIAMYYLHRIRNWIRVRGKVPVVESTATTVEVLKGKQGVDTRQEEHIESTFSSTIDQVVSPAPSYTTETIESVQYQKKVDQRSRRSNSHGSHDSSTSTLVNSPFSLTTDSAKHHHRHSEDDTPSSSFSTVYSESRLQKVMEEDDSIDH
ncbi:hypothetical protein BGZ83_005637 [Gryganskiella cystojenkinii]|nr:hypothetical protein BGZ83_005637 [Gryganskiella cystojenkinii]